MAQFKYTAVSSAGKKLSGVIGAITEEDARKQLNTFGVSLLSIEKTGETVVTTKTGEAGTSNELPRFEFEAYDKLGRKVLGTIPAGSRYNAFKRLVDEYQFEVSYIVPIGATEDEKIKAKQEDLKALKDEYAASIGKTSDEIESESMSKEFEAKRQELLKKVDFILDKIKELIASYGEDIKPESKKSIQSYIDKLLRIKSSTNLDYIEHTSEELLKKVQDQELFLHKEKTMSERTKLKVEAESLMAELHSKPSELKIVEQIKDVHTRLSESQSRFLRGIDQLVTRFIPSKEEQEIDQKIKTINRQIWTYRKIIWTSPKDTINEAKQSLSRLKEERNRLKTERKQLKTVIKNKVSTPEEPLITEEVNSFLGWLLFFYLCAFFASYYFLAKEIPGGNPLPGDFNLLNSGLLKTLFVSIFIWHILITVRLQYLRYNNLANTILFFTGGILNLIIVFNL